jgi:hypothetical protein
MIGKRNWRRRAACSLAAASLAAAAFGGIQHATAGSSSATGPAGGAGAEDIQMVISSLKGPRTTTAYYDLNMIAVPAGFQPLHDPLDIRCPGPGQCAIEAAQHQQVRSAMNNNRWAVCTQVDGVWMNQPPCPYVEVAQASAFFHARTFSQFKTNLLPGNHVVQSFLKSDFGLIDGTTNISYRLYSH